MPATRRKVGANLRKTTKLLDGAKAVIAGPVIEVDAEDWTFVDKICGAAPKQVAFIKRAVQKGARVCCCCGRQSGKSRSAFGAALHLLFKNPGSNGLWIGLSGEAVDNTVWPSIKKYLKEWGLTNNDAPNAPPQIEVKEGKRKLILPNGSELIFLGTDDRQHIESYRGATNVIVILDEVQSQPYDLVQGLVEDILEPSLAVFDGPMIVLGTPPKRRTGWFAGIWFGTNGYLKLTWNGFDNPAYSDFGAYLARIAAGRGVTLDDPKLRREYLGAWVDESSDAVLPGFSVAKNVFEPDPSIERFEYGFSIPMTPAGPAGLPKGNWLFSCGIDGGQRDRLAIEISGHCDTSPNVYEVAAFVAPKNAHLPPSVWVPYVKAWIARYGNMSIYLDPSGISVSALVTDYHLPTTKSAKKVEKIGQLGRVNDLAHRGRLQTVAGSKLTEDCIKTEWSTQKNDNGQRDKYSLAWKQDALDAFRYSICSEGAYFDISKPVDDRTPDQTANDNHRAEITKMLEGARQRETDEGQGSDYGHILGLAPP